MAQRRTGFEVVRGPPSGWTTDAVTQHDAALPGSPPPRPEPVGDRIRLCWAYGSGEAHPHSVSGVRAGRNSGSHLIRSIASERAKVLSTGSPCSHRVRLVTKRSTRREFSSARVLAECGEINTSSLSH